MVTLYVAEWYESERGWGTRFDGFFVTLDYDRHQQVLEHIEQREYELYGGMVPPEYSRPIEHPRKIEVGKLPFHEFVALDKHGAMWSRDRQRWGA